MKRIFFLLVLCSLSEICRSQDMARVRETISHLCAPAFQGRGYLNKGDKKAAKYIAKAFKSIKPKSFQSYFQPFPISVNTFPGALYFSIDNQVLTPGIDYIADERSASGVGFGEAYFLDTLIFTDLSIREKFLKRNSDSEILIYKAKDLSKILSLPKICLDKLYKFKCIIETHKNKLTASVTSYQLPTVSFKVLESKVAYSTKSIRFKINAKIKTNYSSQNVIAYPSPLKQSDSLIVISAHYDHLGRMGRKVYFPGANDNASGVSLMLELAHYFSEITELPKYKIVFIAFGGEEAGLVGSHFFVDNPLFQLGKIKFLINLDLVGSGIDGIAIVNGSLYEKEFNLISHLNQKGKYFSYIKKRGEAGNSDHYYFSKSGVRSFFIYTLGGITAYHDVNDIPGNLPLSHYPALFNLLTDFIQEL